MKREIEGYVIGRDDFSRLNSMALGIAAIGFRAGMRNPEAGVNAILDALDRMEQRNESLIDERNEARIARNKAEAEIEKLKQPLKVEVGDLVRIVGYGRVSDSLAFFSATDKPVFFKVVSTDSEKFIPCVDVKQINDPNGYNFVWTVPICSIIEVKKPAQPEPKIGATRNFGAEVYRSSGWATASRRVERRKTSEDPRAIALAALEAIPNKTLVEMDLFSMMLKKARANGATGMLRSGKDRRKS